MEIFIFVLIIILITWSFAFDLWLSSLNYKHRLEPIPEVVADIYDEKEYKKWYAQKQWMQQFSL